MFFGMTIGTIITQTLALICNAYIAFTKKRKRIYIANILYNLFCILTGIIQRTYSLCTSSCIIIYRSVALIYKQKLKQVCKWFPITFILLHIVTGYFTYTRPSDILSVVAPIMTGLVMWYSDNLQLYRWNNILVNTMWFIYQISISTYILALVNLYAITVNAIALYKNRTRKDNKLAASCLRLLLIGISIPGILYFLLPFVYGGILNLGNVTGILVLLLLLFYGLFMPRIHKGIRGAWKKKAGKLGLMAAGGLAGVVLLLAGIETGCMIHAATKEPTEDATLVVLGCRTYGDRPSIMLASRLDAAYEYLTEHPDAVCVVSGGQGPDEPVSEGEFMYRYLVKKGIAPERIYRETESTSTRENLQFSKDIIEKEGLNPQIAIVTNEYHEYRAAMVAKTLGLEYSAVPAHTPWWLFPTYYIRELYGIIYEWVL